MNLPDLNAQQTFHRFFPGLMCCLTVALAARFLSDHYGAPQLLFALLLGLAFHFLSEVDSCLPGVEFSATVLLKTGVALLGFRITYDEVASLGGANILLVLSAVAATILAGISLSYLLGRKFRFGILTGGAVAICGASAAIAIATVLPKSETRERDTLFTVIAVTTLSTISMVLYPILANLLALDERTTGIFLGATIHDVAQVVGAGYSVSDQSGDIATIIKLVRVALLVPVMLLFTVLLAPKGTGFSFSIIPRFVLVFCVAVAVNSTGVLPVAMTQLLADLSRWLLVTGIVAIGIKTSLKSMTTVGVTAIVILTIETLFIALWVLTGLHLIS